MSRYYPGIGESREATKVGLTKRFRAWLVDRMVGLFSGLLTRGMGYQHAWGSPTWEIQSKVGDSSVFVFPYIVIGGEDAMKLDVVASSGLKTRVAFVLMLDFHNEYDRDANDYEENLVLTLVETVAAALDADINYLEDMDTPTRVSSSIEEFRRKRLPPWEDGSEPLHVPRLIVMASNGVTVGIMVLEGWFNIGGPWPYHDSYTYATYVKDEAARQRVVEAVKEMCQRLAITEPELLPLGASN